jgi:hypothetical protein
MMENLAQRAFMGQLTVSDVQDADSDQVFTNEYIGKLLLFKGGDRNHPRERITNQPVVRKQLHRLDVCCLKQPD